jgi:hypothetical protein
VAADRKATGIGFLKIWEVFCLNFLTILVKNPEGERPLWRPSRGWEDNIKADLQEVGCWDVGVWTGLSWLRIETGGGTCECGNEPMGSVKCGKFLNQLQTG